MGAALDGFAVRIGENPAHNCFLSINLPDLIHCLVQFLVLLCVLIAEKRKLNALLPPGQVGNRYSQMAQGLPLPAFIKEPANVVVDLAGGIYGILQLKLVTVPYKPVSL